MKTFLSISCGLLLAAANVQATALFSDDFNSYIAGDLVGQGGWTITGTSTVNPIQATGSAVTLNTTGQDAYKAIAGGPVTLSDGATLYMDLDLTVNTAQSAGDYFLHYSTTVGNTSTFPDRLFAKSTTGGYLLGWAASSSGVVYGTTVLTLGHSYHVETVYNVIAGAANDTGAIFVDNASYFSGGFGGGSEPTGANAIAEVCFRQGTGSSAPTVLIDNLTASYVVPEPSIAALFGLGLLALNLIRRRS